METFEDRKPAKAGAPERYDKELVRSEVVSVCFHYLGPGRRQGTRYVWRCPECGKAEKFSATASKMLCGCLNAACTMPKTMDAIQMISHFENLPASGAGFVRILQRGYEILNLPDPRASRSPSSPRPAPEPAPEPPASGWIPAPAARKPNSGANQHKDQHNNTAREAPEEDPLSSYSPEEEHEITVEDGRAGLLPDVPEDIVTVDAEEIEEAEVVHSEHGRVPHGRVRYERRDAHRSYQMGPIGEALRGEAEAWALYEEPDFTLDVTLADAVYAAILEMCRLEEPHAEWLKNVRGVTRMTALRGRMGSMSTKRARAVKKALLERFSEEDLLRVPGFSKRPLRGISWTLSGDYLLIPYHDSDHNITTIEGRCVGDPPKGMGKYISLRGSGNHLYVFPDFMPERLEAFCEGPLGAIVAAQSGIAVGAIQGVRRHADSQGGAPLPELAGTDFGKRRIPYIPDIDVKPAARADVIAEVPRACRNLIEQQNGVPQIALLPEAKDLDEWLLTKKSGERRAAFTSFVSGAVSLERYLEATDQSKAQGKNRNDAEPEAHRPVGVKHLANPSTPGPLYEPPQERERGRDQKQGPSRHQVDTSDDTGQDVPVSCRGTSGVVQGRAGQSPSHAPAGAAEASTIPNNEASKVYGSIFRWACAEERDVSLMGGFGVPEDVIREAGLASMSVRRAHAITDKLIGRLGAETLLQIDGFSATADGKVRLDFTGDYLLIPYRDASGAITAIQALPVAEDEQGTRLDPERKTLVRGLSGDHLYVPTGQPEKIEVITTSVLEALRLVACGIRAASVRKVGAYRPAPGASVLAELDGVQFNGKKVLYAPLLGKSPRESIKQDAPNAMRALIARQGGAPAMLGGQPDEPGGIPSGMSLGEWLIALPAWERREKFEARLKAAEVIHGLVRGDRGGDDEKGDDATSGSGRGNEAKAEGSKEGDTRRLEAVVGPVIVPAPGFESPAPPPMSKPLTPDEVLSGVGMIFVCIIFALGALFLWHLPGELFASSVGALGEPVAGRDIDPVAFALLWGESALWAILAAIYRSLSDAVFWGCAAACFLAPFTVWRRRARRRRVREMLRVQSASWWRRLTEALHG